MRVTFMNGPMDKQVMDLPGAMMEYEVARPKHLLPAASWPNVAERTVEIERGFYRRKVNEETFLWAGWESDPKVIVVPDDQLSWLRKGGE